MSIEQIVDRFFAAITSGDAATLEEIYDDRVTIWHNVSGRSQGKAENIENLARVAEAGKGRYVRHEAVVSGNTIAIRHEMQFRLHSGREYVIPVAIFITVENSRITRIHEYFDPSHVPVELGGPAA